MDILGWTAADIAWSYNDEKTYRILFEGEDDSRGVFSCLMCSAEGVRQTLVLNLLDRKKHADSTSRAPRTIANADNGTSTLHLKAEETSDEVSAQNERFLASKLEFVRDGEGKLRCLDVDGGLVMAAWETDVMERTASLLCGAGHPQEGLRVLNVGFGLGIIDECLQKYRPSRHVIVEAHPDALDFAKKQGWNSRAGVEFIPKRWEDALDILGGEQFDVIYWDTYAQGYGGE